MAWRSGSLSRSLLSTTRASFRSSPPLHRLRPPPLAAPRLQPGRFSLANPRTMGELGCSQSFLPLHTVIASTRLTSHMAVDSRACCELTQGSPVLTNWDKALLLLHKGKKNYLSYMISFFDQHSKC